MEGIQWVTTRTQTLGVLVQRLLSSQCYCKTAELEGAWKLTYSNLRFYGCENWPQRDNIMDSGVMWLFASLTPPCLISPLPLPHSWWWKVFWMKKGLEPPCCCCSHQQVLRSESMHDYMGSKPCFLFNYLFPSSLSPSHFYPFLSDSEISNTKKGGKERERELTL